MLAVEARLNRPEVTPSGRPGRWRSSPRPVGACARRLRHCGQRVAREGGPSVIDEPLVPDPPACRPMPGRPWLKLLEAMKHIQAAEKNVSRGPVVKPLVPFELCPEPSSQGVFMNPQTVLCHAGRVLFCLATLVAARATAAERPPAGRDGKTSGGRAGSWPKGPLAMQRQVEASFQRMGDLRDLLKALGDPAVIRPGETPPAPMSTASRSTLKAQAHYLHLLHQEIEATLEDLYIRGQLFQRLGKLAKRDNERLSLTNSPMNSNARPMLCSN